MMSNYRQGRRNAICHGDVEANSIITEQPDNIFLFDIGLLLLKGFMIWILVVVLGLCLGFVGILVYLW